MGNANLTGAPTKDQYIALQISRMVASIPSILGATFIMQHVLRSKQRRQRCLTRILCMMSTHDLLYALTCVFSSTIMPKEVIKPPGCFKMGTWSTCIAFGFLAHGASVTSVVYNASLSLYYLLTIRHGWSERKCHSKLLEPWLHVFPVLIGWGTALAALFMNLFNPLSVACTIAPYPLNCEGSKTTACQRGEHANIYRFAFSIAWVWLVFLFLVGCMLLIYLKLAGISANSKKSSTLQLSSLQQLQQQPPQQLAVVTPRRPSQPPLSSRRKSSTSINNNTITNTHTTLNRLKREFATQALLYCLAFVMTWLWTTISVVYRMLSDAPYAHIPIMFLVAIMNPLHGFWNAFIYIRPRYLRYRRKQAQQEAQEVLQQQREERQQQQQANDDKEQQAPAAASSIAMTTRARQALHAVIAQRGIAFLQATSVNVVAAAAAAANENDDIDKDDEGDCMPSGAEEDDNDDDNNNNCNSNKKDHSIIMMTTMMMQRQ